MRRDSATSNTITSATTTISKRGQPAPLEQADRLADQQAQAAGADQAQDRSSRGC
jgi:hypothetical protein